MDSLESASKMQAQLNTTLREGMFEDDQAVIGTGDLTAVIADAIDMVHKALYSRMKDCLVSNRYSWHTVHEYRQHNLVNSDADEKRLKNNIRFSAPRCLT